MMAQVLEYPQGQMSQALWGDSSGVSCMAVVWLTNNLSQNTERFRSVKTRPLQKAQRTGHPPYIDVVRGLAKSTKRGAIFTYWRISAATSSPNFFWISFWVSGSKSVMSNIRRTSTISLSFPGMREAHSSASSRDFTWMIQ
jgi:hypothetical protein